MRKMLCIVAWFLVILGGNAQDGFQFPNNTKKIEIPFECEKNLILLPMDLNGVRMRFLLDTGVAETILFSLDEKSEVTLLNVETIKMRGLGDQEAIEGLKSSGNILEINGLVKKNEDVIVVLDESFNFSSSLGIAVNGILGSSFFEKNCVEINYRRKKVIVHKTMASVRKFKKYAAFDLDVEGQKPYTDIDIDIDNDTYNKAAKAKLLIDTGSSDALWIFRTAKNKFKIPNKNFDDYLGRGFSGEIYGKKTIINSVTLKNFEFSKVVVAFPDTLSVQKMNLVQNRSGSIGAEILSRFAVVFDYENKKMYLKKNYKYAAAFTYNKSGIELQHSGTRLIQQETPNKTVTKTAGGVKINFGGEDQNIKYKFELKPNFEVVSIRKGSPSENAGLHIGDLILSINGVPSYKYKLQDIYDILKSEDGKNIRLEVERNKKSIKIAFKLLDIL